MEHKIKHKLVSLIGKNRIIKIIISFALLWETRRYMMSLRYIENVDIPTDRT
jgi:hypothetical protein